MAVHTSTLKRQRQSKTRRARNQAILSRLKTLIKKTRKALEAKDHQAIQDAVATTVSALNRAASKGVIHRNKASRTISRLSRKRRQSQPSGSSRGETRPPAQSAS
jgi:small subunit ribosomal protein S20